MNATATTPTALEQARQILDGTTPAPSACCAPQEQEACCEPSEKDACCGTTSPSTGGCGCQ